MNTENAQNQEQDEVVNPITASGTGPGTPGQLRPDQEEDKSERENREAAKKAEENFEKKEDPGRDQQKDKPLEIDPDTAQIKRQQAKGS